MLQIAVDDRDIAAKLDRIPSISNTKSELSTMSVEQSMVLNIHVIYKAPSRELLFLGTGWGGRDIRGPYLSETGAEIIIGNWALSQRIPSRVELTLTVSNRCEVDALFVRATGVFGSTQTLVKK